MRFKATLLATVVVLATVAPAQAQITMGFALSSFMGPYGTDIPDNDTTPGTPITSLTMNPGDTVYVQVLITATGSPGSTNGWANSPTSARLAAFGPQVVTMNNAGAPSVSNIINPFVDPGPFIDMNLRNFNVPAPYGIGHPNTFVGYNMGRTAFTGLTIGTSGAYGPASAASQTFVLGTFALQATNPTPGGQPSFLAIQDINSDPVATTFGLFNGNTLDSLIFNNDPNQYRIPVTVLPEPTSFALAGLALAGLGWKKLRRNKKEVAA